MNEDPKLREARYFLDRMHALTGSPEEFRHNLSAFLSAARSVAQFAFKEAKRKPDGQLWYDESVAAVDRIKFFADIRNANVHDELVALEGHVDVFAKDVARGWERSVVEKFDRYGNLVEVVAGDDANPGDSAWTTDFKFEPHYRFDTWAGKEEVHELREGYLNALHTLVGEGRARGFLTPPQT